MRLFLCISLLLLTINAASSQTIERSVISSFGGTYYDGSSLEVDYTAGEVAIATLGNPTNILTQGFQQPFGNTYVFVEEQDDDPGLVSVYPNPVVDFLIINYKGLSPGEVQICLFDGIGKLLIAQVADLGVASTQLDLSQLATGTYYLRVTQNGEKLFAGKTIKINQ